MSSQFSYELDERQIRLMMQDAELDYNEAMWHKFDEMSVPQAKSSSSIGSYIPKVNIGISRSVIVPVIFIVLIGGLSAMLFSFVDFKKKESIEKEIPYVAKVEPITQPEVKAKTKVNPKTTELPTLKAATPVVDTTTVQATNTNSVAVVIPEVKKEKPVKIVESKPVVNKPSETAKVEPTTIRKRKTKRKVSTEELPTINNAALNLNEGASEPELDLK